MKCAAQLLRWSSSISYRNFHHRLARELTAIYILYRVKSEGASFFFTQAHELRELRTELHAVRCGQAAPKGAHRGGGTLLLASFNA